MTVFIQGRTELEQELVILNTQKGWSIRALARHFGISRNMVRRILRRHERLRDEGHDILKPAGDGTPRPSKLDPFDKTLTHLLEKFPRISGVRLMEELRAAGYAGGISILRDRLRKRRTSPKKEPVIRFETDPGVQGQMDWSPYTIKFLRTGKQQVQCFSYILGFSRRQFIDFTPRRDFFTLIRRHQDAFSHFQGTPAQCLYDSEKTVVLRWEAGRPLINPAFSAFVTHYRIRPVICQRGRAQTKGKIERPFQYSPELALIVRHERVPDGSRLTLDGSAVHGVKTLRYGLEPMRDQFLQLGEHACEFLQGLTLKNPKNPGFHARYILHLKERYSCDDINLALGHACRYHAYDCKAVERILAMKAAPRTLESVRNEKAAKQLCAALPKIKQRSLNDYAKLFTTSNRTEAAPHEDARQCEQNQELPEDLEARPDGESPQ